MAKGKRSGRRTEVVMASHSMTHQDFVGEAAPERARGERRKQEQVKKDQQKQEDATVREMAREFEQEAGLRPSERRAEDRRSGATAKGGATASGGERKGLP